MSSSPTAAASAPTNSSESPPVTAAPPPSTNSVGARVRAFTGQNGGSIGGPTPAFPLSAHGTAPSPVITGAAARTRVASNVPSSSLPPHNESDDHKPHAHASLPVPVIQRGGKPRLSIGSLPSMDHPSSPAPAAAAVGHAPTTSSPSLPSSPPPSGSPPPPPPRPPPLPGSARAELRRHSIKPGEDVSDSLSPPSLTPLLTTSLSSNTVGQSSPLPASSPNDSGTLTINAPAPAPGTMPLPPRRPSASTPASGTATTSAAISVTASPSSDTLSPPLPRQQSEAGTATSGGSEEEKKARTRKRVLEEVLSTEKSYVNDLTTLTSVFMIPLTALTKDPDHAPLTKQQINTLFSNVQVIEAFNKKFLSDFSGRLASMNDQDPTTQCVGDLFLTFAPFFKMYTQYVNSHDHALLMLKKASKDSKFVNFEAKCTSDPHCKGKSLQSFLITPIQRIPRYELLIRELIRNTNADHPDRKNLDTALGLVNSVALHINEAVRRQQNTEKVMHIQEQFSGSVEFVAPGRSFLRQGPLTKVGRRSDAKYEFFLFNDLLVYASGKYKLHMKMPIEEGFNVEDLPDSGSKEEGKNRFKIVSRQKSFIVYAKEKAQKDDWFKDIHDCIEKRRFSIKSSASVSKLSAAAAAHPDEHEPPSVIPKTRPIYIQFKADSTCVVCATACTRLSGRHHCRVCGKIACSNCSKERVLVPYRRDRARACATCAEKIREETTKKLIRLRGSASGAAALGTPIQVGANGAPVAPPKPHQQLVVSVLGELLERTPKIAAFGEEVEHGRAETDNDDQSSDEEDGNASGVESKERKGMGKRRRSFLKLRHTARAPSPEMGGRVVHGMHGHAFPVRSGLPARGGAPSDTESEVEVEEEIEVEEGASYCRATFTFAAQDAREMSITEHDIIEIIEKSEGGWWTGKLGNNQGLFPSNYAKEIVDGDPDLFEAINEYKSTSESELSMNIGDVLVVAQQDSTGWWLGDNSVTKAHGWFPSNFVKANTKYFKRKIKKRVRVKQKRRGRAPPPLVARPSMPQLFNRASGAPHPEDFDLASRGRSATHSGARGFGSATLGAPLKGGPVRAPPPLTTRDDARSSSVYGSISSAENGEDQGARRSSMFEGGTPKGSKAKKASFTGTLKGLFSKTKKKDGESQPGTPNGAAVAPPFPPSTSSSSSSSSSTSASSSAAMGAAGALAIAAAAAAAAKKS